VVRPSRLVRIGEHAVRQGLRHDVIWLSAELAYRFFLALFPFLIFLVALGAAIAATLGQADPSRDVVRQLTASLPPEASALIAPELERLIAGEHPALLSLGGIFALVFATGGTNALIKALDRVAELADHRTFAGRYALALLMTLVGAAGLVVSTSLLVGGQLILSRALDASALGVLAGALPFGGWLVSLVLVGAVAAILYGLLPARRPRPRAVLPGATAFALAWTVATLGFGIYVTDFGRYSVTYGTLAGVAVLLIWLYLSALLLLAGAELNVALEDERGAGA
jgi:membrane protein